MTRPKKSDAKIHITATIDPDIHTAMKSYNDDEANRIDGNKPGISWIVNEAVKKFLASKPKSINPDKAMS